MSDDNNVRVMNTPKWSVRQALLAALEECEKDKWEGVAIIGKTESSEEGEHWYPNVIGGKVSNATLYYMGHVIQRRVHDEEVSQ